MSRSRRTRAPGTPPRALPMSLVLAVVLTTGCQTGPEPSAIPLVDRFSDARVEGTLPAESEPPHIEWLFEDESTRGWTAVHDLQGLAVREGRLVGRAGELALLAAPGPESPDASDFFHALEVKLRVSKGTRLGVSFDSAKELEPERLVKGAKENAHEAFNVDLRPGEKVETYTVTAADASFNTSYPLSSIRHVVLRITGAEGAEVEIASMRLVTLKEHLASIPSGVGW